MADDAEAYVFDFTYTYDGTHYRSGDPMPAEVAEALEIKEKGTPVGEASEEEGEPEEGTPLPESFPAVEKLYDAGYRTIEGVDRAPDEDLTDITGIADARLEAIRETVDNMLS